MDKDFDSLEANLAFLKPVLAGSGLRLPPSRNR